MFDFAGWAEWLENNHQTLQSDGLAIVFHDTRPLPECALNPCVGIDAETPRRVGTIRFWQVGLCDYQVLDFSREDIVAAESMLEANDDTVRSLLSTFISFFAESAD